MRVGLQFEGKVVITGKLAEADLRSLLSLF
jgi:hypothetical protein